MTDTSRLIATDLAAIRTTQAAAGDLDWEVYEGKGGYCVFDEAGDGICVANCYGSLERATFIAAAKSWRTL